MNLEQFTEAIINLTNFDNQEVYINVLDDSNISKLYKEICSLHGLKQAIESFTCITEKTSTLIEHILTNSVENISQHGVLEKPCWTTMQLFATEKLKNKNIISTNSLLSEPQKIIQKLFY